MPRAASSSSSRTCSSPREPSFKPFARRRGRVSLDLARPPTQPVQARFVSEDGATKLRLQCFLVVRDGQDRIATLKVQGIDGWCIPGESMLMNESPDQAAVRVARTWFDSPVGMQLDRILSFPATGGDDDRWYLIFVYHADAPAGGLKGTSDTEAIEFRSLGDAAPTLAMSHGDVWNALKG